MSGDRHHEEPIPDPAGPPPGAGFLEAYCRRVEDALSRTDEAAERLLGIAPRPVLRRSPWHGRPPELHEVPLQREPADRYAPSSILE